MPSPPYNTKVSNWMTDVVMAARRKLREKAPTQEQFDEETKGIRLNDPNYVEARKPKSYDEVNQLRVSPDTGNPVLDTLMDPLGFDTAGAHLAGGIIGGPERFGQLAKKAKDMLKEWHGLGLKDLTLEHAMDYLKKSPEEILKGDKLATRIAEAGGSPSGHLTDDQVSGALTKMYPNEFNDLNRPTPGDVGMASGQLERPDLFGQPGSGLENPAVTSMRELNPGLESQIPKINAPRTPADFSALDASIPNPRAGIEGLPPNQAGPLQEFNPSSMVDRREGPRRGGRVGAGRRQSDQDFKTAYEIAQQGSISGASPDMIADEMIKVGLNPEDYADLLGAPNLGGAPQIGGLTPAREAPPGVAAPMVGNTPENMVSGIRQQPQPTGDFNGAVSQLLQATNDWDKTVQHLVEQAQKNKAPKEELVNMLMDGFGHENPQLSTLVNKHWK